MRVLVVGAGYAGSVSAERLASAGHDVLLIDKRSHIAGNAFDELDENGILVHRYGPHIFHTNAERVFDYLSRFTRWRPYEHRVLAEVRGQRLPIPINRTTINRLYGLDLDEAGVAGFFERVREPREKLTTSEDVVLNSIGRELCDLFFRGYTRKQWGLELAELSAGVAARIPTRSNDDDRYFTDRFQQMPRDGYAAMFANMLDHSRIRVELETAFAPAMRERFDLVVYTGPIDAWFGYCFGALPYRSLGFAFEHLAIEDYFLPTGSVNFPNSEAFTRITEFKHLTGQQATGTTIVREYPQAQGEPYYPIPRPENEALYQRYKALAAKEAGTIFVGRLAQYRYYNMDQVIAAALTAVEGIG
ncbi:MAG: UDP-galactopyranose mutase [Devosia sp.]